MNVDCRNAGVLWKTYSLGQQGIVAERETLAIDKKGIMGGAPKHKQVAKGFRHYKHETDDLWALRSASDTAEESEGPAAGCSSCGCVVYILLATQSSTGGESGTAMILRSR